MLDPLGRANRLVPVFFKFVDFQQPGLRAAGPGGAFELGQRFFGAIQQAGLQVVLPQLVQCMQALFVVQIGTIGEARMHADRTLDLATAAK